MASEKVETVVAGNYVEMGREEDSRSAKSKLSKFFWHGGSVYDAWFSCASNQALSLVTNFFFYILAWKTNTSSLLRAKFVLLITCFLVMKL